MTARSFPQKKLSFSLSLNAWKFNNQFFIIFLPPRRRRHHHRVPFFLHFQLKTLWMLLDNYFFKVFCLKGDCEILLKKDK